MKDRQRRFADEYLIDLNAEAAAVRAGYSPRYARGNAYKLVARSGIKEYIEKRMAEKESELIADQNGVRGKDKRKMAYEVINEKLKVEACRIGDLTMDQVESFLKLWGDGEKIETLTLFSRRDGTIVLNRDNKNYPYYKDIVEAYLEFDEDTRKKMEVPEGARETLRVLDRAIEQRKLIEVLDMLKYSYIGEVPREIIQSIFQKYDSGLIGLCQVFIYGVIEGKRAERARRKAHNV